MKTRTLEITGMKCDGCVESVTSALEDVEGVRRAEVSLEEGRAKVDADLAVTVDDLVDAVEEAGFSATTAR